MRSAGDKSWEPKGNSSQRGHIGLWWQFLHCHQAACLGKCLGNLTAIFLKSPGLAEMQCRQGGPGFWKGLHSSLPLLISSFVPTCWFFFNWCPCSWGPLTINKNFWRTLCWAGQLRDIQGRVNHQSIMYRLDSFLILFGIKGCDLGVWSTAAGQKACDCPPIASGHAGATLRDRPWRSWRGCSRGQPWLGCLLACW